MPNQFQVAVNAPPASRQSGTFWSSYEPSAFIASGSNATWSWGVSPNETTLTYALPDSWRRPESGGIPIIPIGASMRLSGAGHIFWGVCLSDTIRDGSDGRERTLRFADNRHWLEADKVFCAFNIPDDTLYFDTTLEPPRNRRVRRWKHIYPADFSTGIPTYSYDRPLFANEILSLLFSAPTVADVWSWESHPDQQVDTGYPLAQTFDWSSGSSLAAAISSLCEAQGLTVTLMGGPYNLVFARKGEGSLPDLPEHAGQVAYDSYESGLALTGNPTRIRVLGDRNLYQVQEIPMVKDWAPGWEMFYDASLFIDEIFQFGTTSTSVTIPGHAAYPAGTAFSALIGSGDPDQLIAHQLAKARAEEITVGEYIALLDAETKPDFIDSRKYCGRSRMDMPAMLYIEQIVLRAFRLPDDFSITTAMGDIIPQTALTISEKMVAKVEISNPTAGPTQKATSINTNESQDGNGFAIVQGYQVMSDLFRSINPEHFSLEAWKSPQNVWARASFRVDQGGDDTGPYILFDAPVFTAYQDDVSHTPLVEVLNNYAFFNEDFTLTIPPVRACLTFEAEPYIWDQGDGVRTEIVNAQGLHAEYVGYYNPSHGANVEIPYYDGRLADDHASEIASPLLSRQYYVWGGSLRRIVMPNPNGSFNPGTQLTSMMDRVSLEVSDRGLEEVIYLTNEHPRVTFVPERDLSRGEREKTLLPGQEEIRYKHNVAVMTAKTLQQSPDARKTLRDAFNGNIGEFRPTGTLNVTNGGADAILPGGTPLWKKRNDASGAAMADSSVVLPTTSAHIEFAGATINNNANAASGRSRIRAQYPVGDILVRVKGPVTQGDSVGGPSAGHDYLIKDGTNLVGTAMQGITDTSVKVIKVRTAGVGGGTSKPVQRYVITGVSNDYLSCRLAASDGTAIGPIVKVAKPKNLRYSTWNNISVSGWRYSMDTGGNTRSATVNGAAGYATGAGFSEELRPAYIVGNFIYAAEGDTGLVILSEVVSLLDTNVDARNWFTARQQMVGCEWNGTAWVEKRMIVDGGGIY